jgi:hypothetical protein
LTTAAPTGEGCNVGVDVAAALAVFVGVAVAAAFVGVAVAGAFVGVRVGVAVAVFAGRAVAVAVGVGVRLKREFQKELQLVSAFACPAGMLKNAASTAGRSAPPSFRFQFNGSSEDFT